MKVRKLLALWSLSLFPICGLGSVYLGVLDAQAQPPKASQPLSGNILAETTPPRPQRQGGSRVREERGELPWETLYEKEPPRPEETGGSRSPVEELCLVSPESLSEELVKVWSDRPLFLWRGSIGKIELRRHRTSQVVWSQLVAENDRKTTYDGTALQPGETYDWVVFEANASFPTLQASFQVLPTEERDRMTAELQQLEDKLQKEGATPEKIAYERANYFASRQMWPDVIQSAYSVKDPSETLMKFQEGIPKRFCSVPTALGQ